MDFWPQTSSFSFERYFKNNVVYKVMNFSSAVKNVISFDDYNIDFCNAFAADIYSTPKWEPNSIYSKLMTLLTNPLDNEWLVKRLTE